MLRIFSLASRFALGLSLSFACGLPAEPLRAEGEAAEANLEQLEAEALEADVTQGALRIVEAPDAKGAREKAGDKPAGEVTVVECPLKHTDVQVEIAGFLARVNVTQTFHNPLDKKIEAVYVFPLPNEAAVDGMTMVVGERKIVGQIKRRQEARSIYEQALQAGHAAALLEQERPNIFTQSVGNIEPGQEVRIEISYVDVLKYDVGSYEFHFPMVVGPRYNPGGPIASPGDTPPELTGKVSPPVADTDRVPDASRISPPVLKPEFRNGHDVSLSIKLDAGVPIQDLTSGNHSFSVDRDGDAKAEVRLSPADSLPNKDFVLRYKVVGKKPEMALLAHTGKHAADAARAGEGYFLLMIQPSEDEKLTKSPPREIVFLVDVSGSMSGEPTAKVQDAMRHMLGLCREKDTVQVVTFASDANKLFEKPLPCTKENIRRAVAFTDGTTAGGGTEMLKGVKLAIDEPLDAERVRIVVMLTDGYIGNEAEIIEHVGKNCGDKVRFWGVGIGASPNMFLIDGVAAQGGGMGKRLGLEDDPTGLTTEIMSRIQRAQLANISLDWNGLAVSETYPAKLPELWAGRPVMVLGRYQKGGAAQITVRGTVEGEAVEWPLAVDLPASEPSRDSLAKAWARKKIEDLMQQSFYLGSPAVEEEVTAIALNYGLMSQYTSFVAVDPTMPMSGVPATPPQRMLVPVPLPEGTLYEGFFGGGEAEGLVRLEDEAAREVFKGAALGRFDSFGKEKKNEAAQRLYSRESLSTAHYSFGTTLAGVRGGAVSGGGGYGGLGASPMAGKPVAAFRRLTVADSKGFAPASSTPMPQGVTLSRSRIAKREFADYDGVAAESRLKGLALGEVDKRLSDRLAVDSEILGDQYQFAVQHAAPEQAAALDQAATKAIEQAREHAKNARHEEAMGAFTRSYLSSLAAMNAGHASDGQISQEALQGASDAHDALVKSYVSKQAALGAKLDFVLSDVSIAEALAKIAEAGNLKVMLVPGSEADAAGLIGEGATRITWLDLRGATSAQALDWVLLPARLTWRLDEDGIVAGSSRRLNDDAAWVYDVAAMTAPLRAELAKAADDAAKAELVKVSLAKFLKVVRAETKAGDATAAWYAPGRILLQGDRQLHARMEKLLADLANAKSKLKGESAELRTVVVKRLAERNKPLKAIEAARRQMYAAATLDAFGWPLLAAAAGGELDDEALAELSIVWKGDEVKTMLAGDGRTLALASAWAIGEASKALPEESELAALAAKARELSNAAGDEDLEKLAQAPDEAAAFSSVLFAALTRRDDADFQSRAAAAFSAKRDAASPLAPLVVLAESLLSDPRKIDRAALKKQIDDALAGGEVFQDAHAALLALACRRAGGEVWERFRASSRDLFGGQPIRSEIIVLASRLGGVEPLIAVAKD